MSDSVNKCEHCHVAGEANSERIKQRSEKQKQALVTRLNRVEGQIRGIKGMVEKDIYCDDILNQVSAVQSALKSISKLILEGHMKSCLIDRVRAGDTEVVDELLDTIGKML